MASLPLGQKKRPLIVNWGPVSITEQAECRYTKTFHEDLLALEVGVGMLRGRGLVSWFLGFLVRPLGFLVS